MRDAFHAALRERQGRWSKKAAASRRWVYVPYDQLTDSVGPLASLDPEDAGIVVVENPWKAARRPYHKQKLAFVLASQRQFALEQAERGVLVKHIAGPGGSDAVPYRTLLEDVADELGPMQVMRPAERELRHDLDPLFAAGALEEIPHAGWMTSTDDLLTGSNKTAPWRMDVFYKHVRKRTGVLMDDSSKPLGGKFSFDAENRKPWRGDPPAAEPPTFDVDDVTQEVVDLIAEHYAHHPGVLDPTSLPTRARQVVALWRWAKADCLPMFGPYEDAMSVHSRNLFHTRISPLLNVLRLLPADVVRDAEALDLPLASQEGFIRQVLGWREFMHHVHEQTDGFRTGLPDEVDSGRATTKPGNANIKAWSGEAWKSHGASLRGSGSATPSFLDAHGDLPPAFWGAPSGLNCLDHVTREVHETAYSHHITRLMVLSNLGTLLDVEPRQLTDWFWCSYMDAYDWVVEPNVLGMGTFGVGELFTTKPYVSGSAYIDRMSDYCKDCAFHPKKTCPITRLYWAFMERQSERLAGNMRIGMPLRNVAKRKTADKELDRATFDVVRDMLARGDSLTPESLGDAVESNR
jgi:deoxyribodipyrimidine photolyase-related protein